MQRFCQVLFAMGLCLLVFAGCSGCGGTAADTSGGGSSLVYTGPPSTPPGLIAPNPDDVAPGTSAPPPDTTLPGSESTSAASTEHSLAGIIDSAGMGEFMVELEDGRFVIFKHDGVDMSGLKDTRPGSPIIIYYQGEFTGVDTSTITVTRMATP